MQNYKLSVLVPAYKEYENIKLLLPKLILTLKKYSRNFEIIIVENLVTDPRYQSLIKKNNKKFFLKKNNIKIINRKPSDSYGDAIRSGIEHLNSEHTVIMDADGSHDPIYINQFIQKYTTGNYDLIIASRYVKGGYSNNSLILKALSIILNKFFSLTLKLNCKDISNSFRFYKTNQLKSIKLIGENFDIVEEILIKLTIKYQVKILEIPFSFNKRLHGKSKRKLLSFMFSYLKLLIHAKNIKSKNFF
ncbi:hypothetical protein VI34_06490 [Methylophilales bacterium MBRSG12]|uniref:Glycosyltransferase 2-like domain-containing protein n=1 Tax=Methylophilales bacterium MBRS-H7 TaxID=1623450 RepID=A0A0H4J0K1_9PROT|nr:hypothetical protein UZ34_03835 [Methylophilales bacterium MBRSF5]AKO66309.1 hypothetical protein VI33_06500 [Methylophilales bacterium MBRS-H7]AKO67625.1 hypothetical protein VI34_06490 [Methylophilales bacterium MBRSG12]